MKYLQFIWSHKTKALGFAQVTIGALATGTSFFSPKALQGIMLLSGLLTAWVGF